MKYNCIYDSWKKTGQIKIFPIFYIIIFQRIFPPKGETKKKILQIHFFFQYSYFWYTIPFVEHDYLWACVWSAMGSSRMRWGPLECDGVLWNAITPLENDAIWVYTTGNFLQEEFWAIISQIQQNG